MGVPFPPFAAATPVAGTKSIPVGWPATIAGSPYAATVLPAASGWCVAPVGGVAVFNGIFTDIGFVASGNTNFQYRMGGSVLPAPIAACALGAVVASGVGALGDTGFITTAQANLDGDASISTWAASSDQGSQDCTTGTF